MIAFPSLSIFSSALQAEMGYRTLKSCMDDLKRTGQLVEFAGTVDPHLEMAAVQRRLFREKAPAVLFTNPICTNPGGGTPAGRTWPMLANLYGTEERLHYIFRDGIKPLRTAVELGADPVSLLSEKLSFKKTLPLGLSALSSLYYSKPKRVSSRNAPALQCQTTLDELPQLVSWPDDGGPYITLPLVYTEHPERPGFGRSNLGMYRVQLAGNDYVQNSEVGLHYQIHRGIAAHHAAALELTQNSTGALRVNIFVGGAPCMTLAAVMPMPEDVSELHFAGILGRHRIPMTTAGGSILPVYAEADFCISGTMFTEVKREGPFGDHLGYYSLGHDFPVLKVDHVWHRKDAVWPFTVVGRPPQEDTMFGKFIHGITGNAVTKKISGIHAVHAVDAAGVHPLLLALGRETYLPLDKNRRAAELHTLAHALFGYGQLSLAKYLFLAAKEDDPSLDVDNVLQFLRHILERADWRRDVHFVTKTTADTLDYSAFSDGELNRGSKMFVAVSGPPIRTLATSVNQTTNPTLPVRNPRVALPGVLCVEEIAWQEVSPDDFPAGFPLIVYVDDANEASANLRNFLWTTFTKSDPATDVHGVGEFFDRKHWGCTGPLVIDARRKPHHAPELVESPEIAGRADRIVERILDRRNQNKPGTRY